MGDAAAAVVGRWNKAQNTKKGGEFRIPLPFYPVRRAEFRSAAALTFGAVASGNQARSLQCQIQRGQKEQLDNNSGQAGDEIGGCPCLEGVGAGGEDKGLCKSSCHASCQHGGNQADIKVCRNLSGMYQLHEQPSDKAVYGKFDYHAVEDRTHGGHPADQTGKQGANQTAGQAIGPAADQPAQQHGEVHRGKQRSCVGNGVDCHGQHCAQRYAHGGGSTFCYRCHLVHIDLFLRRRARNT